MADPFSVAGTAVGITSLGIQTLQLLYQYYSKAVGYHEDIDRVVRQVAELQETLAVLQRTTDRFSADVTMASLQLSKALNSCQGALMSLNEMTAIFCSPKHNQSWKRLRHVKKRLTWPFKQATVKQLQAHLGMFQDNLVLALQCAGLDAILNKIEEVPSGLDSIVQQSSKIDQQMVQQTDLLKELKVHTIEASGINQQHLINLGHELRELQAQHYRSHDLLARHFQLILSEHSQVTAPPFWNAKAPRSVRSNCRHLSKPQISNQSNSIVLSMNSLRLCNCHMAIQHSPRKFWAIVVISDASNHQSQCVFSKESNSTSNIILQLLIYTRLIGFCIQIGWSIARTNGWSVIAPTLSYRAIVSSVHSPVFKLFGQAIYEIQDCDRSNQILIRRIVSNTVAKLPSIFEKDARPTDIDEFGRGIMSIVLEFLAALIRRGFRDREMVGTLLRLCLEQRVPLVGHGSNDRSSVVEWQELISRHCWWIKDTSMFHDILMHLIRNSGGWSVITDRDTMSPRLSLVYESIYEALKFEQLYDAWEEDNDMLRIILRRSLTDFDYLLRREHMEDIIAMLLDADVSRALSSWTNGLRLFYSYAPSGPGMHTLTTNIWNNALWFENLRSLGIILPYCSLKMEDWTNVNLICMTPWLRYRHKDDVFWSEFLYDTAQQLLVFGLLDSNYGSEDVDNYGIPCFQQPLLFHTQSLAVMAAEIAWAAGCRDLNTVRIFPEDEITSGPSLWISTTSKILRTSRKWEIIQWLLKHGADTTWTHPTLRTTPLHVISRLRIGFECNQSDQNTYMSFEDILRNDFADQCECFCSRRGCQTLGCVVSKHVGSFSKSCTSVDKLSMALTKGRSMAWRIVEENKHNAWMASAVLRVLTFERLSLTHTCCYQILEEIKGRFSRPSPELAHKTHTLEWQDIRLLDDLVVNFEAMWARYNKSFRHFLALVWEPYMEDLIGKRQTTNPTSYRLPLIRIGGTFEKSQRKTLQNKSRDMDSAFLHDKSLDDISGSGSGLLYKNALSGEEKKYYGRQHDSDDDYLSAHEEVDHIQKRS